MKIGIVTINYNNLSGLKKTRESIVSQTYKDYEWIVIDGGSTDGAKEFLQEHSSEMSYWCSERDKGVYNALNKGTQHVTGDYIICMNSGDFFYDEYVLEHVCGEKLTADVVYGDWVQLYEDGHTNNLYGPKTFSLHFICKWNLSHQAIFARADIMKNSPYDERYDVIADWAKWVELTLKKCTFQYVPYNICYFAMGGLSCTSNRIDEEIKMLRETEMSPAIIETMHYIDDLNKDLDRVNKNINDLNKDLDRVYKEINAVNAQRDEFREKVNYLNSELNQLNDRCSWLHEQKEIISCELNTYRSREKAYMSYPFFKILYKLIRAYRKHIRKFNIY